ncbi:glycosyltransferase [Candidatus Babeliales bacterium]|nr:glycosyltransferase [Candidatus Babeliales bacterium]
MRIFYASDTTPNATFQSNLWRNNLYLPLVDLGHKVIEFDYDLRETFQNLNPTDPIQKKFIKRNRPKLSQELLRQIKQAHQEKPIDLFFSYFYDACVFPETIDEIKSMGIKTINWYCNGSYQLDLVSQISPHYDYCLVPEKFRLEDYERLGANPIYCQEAANPNIYKPYDIAKEFDVTFVGQAYGDRPLYLKYLLDNNINIRVWGIGWERNKKPFFRRILPALRYRLHYLLHPEQRKVVQKLGSIPKIILPAQVTGPVLSDEKMIKMYSRSKINLGFSSCGNTHDDKERILQVRLRDFEVPMSGGFYMVEQMKELEEFFEIGKEIVCYHNKQDLVDKIKYYLKHDAQREKIRLAGHKRCLQDHTWHKRFKMVFDKIKEPSNASNRRTKTRCTNR